MNPKETLELMIQESDEDNIIEFSCIIDEDFEPKKRRYIVTMAVPMETMLDKTIAKND
jgi:hypothetical protein